MKTREFRSDTMTLPTQAMRDAMRDAVVGDDVCDEDPTVNRLQEMAAELLGMEAALFVPSGTFGNQCAIGVHTRPGEEMILSETMHVIDHEAGAAGALWGVQARSIPPTTRSWLTALDIEPRIRTVEDVHHPDTGLIVVENALANGSVMPLEDMRAVRELANRNGIPIHLDGARLFNAALSLGVPASAIAALVDSVTFCLSKGLGAPAGSLLCGRADFVRRAKWKRKMMGGGMRQAGVLAAPAIIALTDGVARLGEDHANARLLAELLAEIPGVRLDLESVQTNMVWFELEEREGRSMEGLAEFLSERGMTTYPPMIWGLRFVTSSRVDEADVRALAEAVSEYARCPSRPSPTS